MESYTFTFSETDFDIERCGDTISVKSRDMDCITTVGAKQPILPLYTKRILNPMGETVNTFDVTIEKHLIDSGVVMKALGEPILANEWESGTYPPKFTQAEESVMTPVELVDADVRHHGYSYSLWSVTPILYDATEKNLYLVDSITLTINREAERSTQSVTNSSRKVRADMMDWSLYLNSDVKSTYSSHIYPLGIKPGEERIDYVIITADSLMDAFDEIVKWKNMKGVRTKVVSVNSIYEMPCEYTEPQEKIKSYLYKLYQNNGLRWCMLGGDDTIIPAKYCHMIYNSKIEHIPSDFYYGGYDGDFLWNANNNDRTGELDDNVDYTPEVHITRLPIRTVDDIHAFSAKLIKYERNPSRNSYLNKMLFSGSKLYKINSDGRSDAQIDADRIRSEINGYTENMKCDILFDTYSNIDGTSFITVDNLQRQIDKGYHLINCFMHGGNDCFLVNKDTWAKYTMKNVFAQTNANSSILFAASCDTNAFDNDSIEPCLSESFIRNPVGGTVAYIGWSRVEWVNTGLDYISHFYYRLLGSTNNKSWENNISALVDWAKSTYILLHAYPRFSILWNFFALNVMGDAEMGIYTPEYSEIDISIQGNHIEFKCPTKHNINYAYSIIRENNPNVISEEINTIPNLNPTCELPEGPLDVTFSGKDYIPLTYKNRIGQTYILNNCTIDYNLIVRANKIIIGENVTVKPDARLRIIASDEIVVRSNVKCEKNARLEMIYE